MAPAKTNIQRGVMTATPNDRSLGLTMWTRTVDSLPHTVGPSASPRDNASWLRPARSEARAGNDPEGVSETVQGA